LATRAEKMAQKIGELDGESVDSGRGESGGVGVGSIGGDGGRIFCVGGLVKRH
jgi:hypothetical protein